MSSRRSGKEIWETEKAIFEIIEREHPITLRGVFYRAVSAHLFPSTAGNYYQQCGRAVQNLRKRAKESKVPWQWIIDSSRTRQASNGFNSLHSYVDFVADGFSLNYWLDQPKHVEVFTEKDAMTTILEPVIRKWNLPFTVIRGQASDTICYDVADKLGKVRKPLVALYLGDFDPSGLNIEKNVRFKIELEINRYRETDREIDWHRVSVNVEQFRQLVPEFGIPLKEKKETPSSRVFKKDYGNQRVEVDAIPSSEVRETLESHILQHIDLKQWKASRAREAAEEEQLQKLFAKIRKAK
jgi:hypothetical protein